MLMTVEQFRQFKPDVALSDDAIRIRLDANEAAIVQRAGPLAEHTEVVHGNGRQTLLPLKAEPATITLVTDGYSGREVIADDTDGYLIEGTWLRRTGRAWSQKTSVTYLPKQDAATRIVVLVDLMEADLNFAPGMAAQSTGGWQEAYSPDHLAVRENILDRLVPRELFA